MAVAAATNQNALAKLGAHLRWMVEQQGIDPETIIISVGVKGEIEKSLMISAFLRNFDGKVMRRMDDMPDCVIVHGIPIVVVADKRKDQA